MEQLGNVLAAVVVFASLWLVRKLTKAEIHKEDLLGLKNGDLSSMPLDDYERDLDKVFDYSKITTIGLHEVVDDLCADDYRDLEEKEEENIAGEVSTGEVPGDEDLQ